MDLRDGLVGHWPLDRHSYDQATHQFRDLSAEGNHGTGVGELATVFDFAINNRSIGSGATPFRGVADHVNCGNDASLNFDETESFSFSYCVKFPTGTTNPRWSLGKGNAYDGPGYGISHWHTTDVPITPLFYFNDDAVPRVSLGAGTIARGRWGHFAWTINRTTNVVKSYMDGVYVSQASIAGVGDTSNNEDFYIGRHVTSYGYSDICDVRIYNRVPSAIEIEQLSLVRKGVYETTKIISVPSKIIKISKERSLIV